MKDIFEDGQQDVRNQLAILLEGFGSKYLSEIEGSSNSLDSAAPDKLNEFLHMVLLGQDVDGQEANPRNFTYSDFSLSQKGTNGRKVNLLWLLEDYLQDSNSPLINEIREASSAFVNTETNKIRGVHNKRIEIQPTIISPVYNDLHVVPVLQDAPATDVLSVSSDFVQEYETIGIFDAVPEAFSLTANGYPEQSISVENAINISSDVSNDTHESEAAAIVNVSGEDASRIEEENEYLAKEAFIARSFEKHGQIYNMPKQAINIIAKRNVELLLSDRDAKRVELSDFEDTSNAQDVSETVTPKPMPLLLRSDLRVFEPETVTEIEGELEGELEALKQDDLVIPEGMTQSFTGAELLENQDYVQFVGPYDSEAQYNLIDGVATKVEIDAAILEESISDIVLEFEEVNVENDNLSEIESRRSLLASSGIVAANLGWVGVTNAAKGINNLASNAITGTIAAGIFVAAIGTTDSGNEIMTSLTDLVDGFSTAVAEVEPVDRLGNGRIIAINGVPVATTEPLLARAETSEPIQASVASVFNVPSFNKVNNLAITQVAMPSEPIDFSIATFANVGVVLSSAADSWRNVTAQPAVVFSNVTGFSEYELNQYATSYVDPQANVVMPTYIAQANDSLWDVIENEFAEQGVSIDEDFTNIKSRIAQYVHANPSLANNPNLISEGVVLVVPYADEQEAVCNWSRISKGRSNACTIPTPTGLG